MSNVAIELKDVSYVYPDGFVALDHVDLEVTKEEMVAFLGPNGAGKSTLLMQMAGVLRPSQGEVRILGMPVNERNIHHVRKRVGLVFQNPDDQLFCNTVFEDVAYGPLNLGLPEEEVVSRSREALREVGLEGYENRLPHHLSEGEKKKAAIATVLSMQPEILIVDEPTANLDPKSREELIELITNLSRERKSTLVIATHDVDIASEISDRMFVLNQGRILTEGTVKEVFSRVDLLREARLEPPSIFRIFCTMAERNIAHPRTMPLTIEAALNEIQDILERQKSSKA